MPNSVGQNIMVPSQSYHIQMIIDDLDYSNDLIKVQIVSSLMGAYQIIAIDLVLDQQDILLKRLYGKSPIKLIVRYLTTESMNGGNEVEKLTFDLMQITDVSIAKTTKQDVIGKSKELSKVTILTVPRKPFITMGKMVNNVFYGKTPYEALTTIFKDAGAGINFDTNNINTTPIDQILVPPMTLYKAIEYMDYQFGIYNGGVSNHGFCQYDNTITVQNLSKKVNSQVAFTVYHVAMDTDLGAIIKDSYDGTKFVTRDNLESEYNANTSFCHTPNKITYNVKPTTTLYQQVSFTYSELCKKNGVYTGNAPEIYHDPILDDREMFRVNHTGVDMSSAFAKSRMARNTVDFASLKVFLSKNIQISNLLRVGEAVRVEPKTAAYVGLGGNYILKASEITFNKETTNWMSSAMLVLNRTNKTID